MDFWTLGRKGIVVIENGSLIFKSHMIVGKDILNNSKQKQEKPFDYCIIKVVTSEIDLGL